MEIAKNGIASGSVRDLPPSKRFRHVGSQRAAADQEACAATATAAGGGSHRCLLLAGIDHKHIGISVASLMNRAQIKSGGRTARTCGNRHQDNRVTTPLFALYHDEYNTRIQVSETLTKTSYIREHTSAPNSHTHTENKTARRDTRRSKTHSSDNCMSVDAVTANCRSRLTWHNSNLNSPTFSTLPSTEFGFEHRH